MMRFCNSQAHMFPSNIFNNNFLFCSNTALQGSYFKQWPETIIVLYSNAHARTHTERGEGGRRGKGLLIIITIVSKDHKILGKLGILEASNLCLQKSVPTFPDCIPCLRHYGSKVGLTRLWNGDESTQSSVECKGVLHAYHRAGTGASSLLLSVRKCYQHKNV